MQASSGFTTTVISRKDHGVYPGEALVLLPSGERARVAVYKATTIYFGDPRPGNPQFSGGVLEREVQTALREALRNIAPELFVDEGAEQ
jgi:hypothetical protein